MFKFATLHKLRYDMKRLSYDQEVEREMFCIISVFSILYNRKKKSKAPLVTLQQIIIEKNTTGNKVYF